jgi:hypothetical protein
VETKTLNRSHSNLPIVESWPNGLGLDISIPGCGPVPDEVMILDSGVAVRCFNANGNPYRWFRFVPGTDPIRAALLTRLHGVRFEDDTDDQVDR